MNKRKTVFYLIQLDLILYFLSFLSLTPIFGGGIVASPVMTCAFLLAFSTGNLLYLAAVVVIIAILSVVSVCVRRDGKKAGVMAFVWYVLETALTVYMIMSGAYHIFWMYYFKLFLNISILIALFLYLKTKRPIVTTEESKEV